MKLFGEYLTERGLVTEEDLTAAILQQIAALPTIPEILFQFQLMSHANILRALKFQSQQKIEFKRSCEILGLWDFAFEGRIKEELNRVRVPIGEMLVLRQRLSREQLNRALTEYFDQPQQHRHESSAVGPGLNTSQLSLLQVEVDEKVFADGLDAVKMQRLLTVFRLLRLQKSESLVSQLLSLRTMTLDAAAEPAISQVSEQIVKQILTLKEVVVQTGAEPVTESASFLDCLSTLQALVERTAKLGNEKRVA